MCKLSFVSVLVLSVISLSSLAYSQALFTDDFESDLSNWTGKSSGTHHGIIVGDPVRTGNNVLTFNELNNAGDIFSVLGITLELGKEYEFSLEYLGLAEAGSVPDEFGGFAGLADDLNPIFDTGQWMFSTKASYALLREHLIDDGQWRNYSYNFIWDRSEIDAVDDVVHVMLEDWISSGGVAGDAYFDNISVTLIPEPMSISIFFFGSLVLSIRKKRA